MQAQPVIVTGRFAELECAVRTICAQIDTLTHHIPDEEDRSYANIAKDALWRMVHSAQEHALARTGLQ
ncbi:MAG TPA: hypothetical protein VKV40_14695 [Ktedonobacteraceae bacterium]|jgi:hypothetical protein|nr:hypothetical protein [Ktedonobacteraceae bacterium]